MKKNIDISHLIEKLITWIINQLPPLDMVVLIIGAFCWCNDFYYTFRTFWEILCGRYPYEFWGTIQFLFFTLATFVAITFTRPKYWNKLSIFWRQIVGLEMLSNWIYIKFNLPRDMWTASTVELAQWYSFVDVMLITYAVVFIAKGCYDTRKK